MCANLNILILLNNKTNNFIIRASFKIIIIYLINSQLKNLKYNELYFLTNICIIIFNLIK